MPSPAEALARYLEAYDAHAQTKAPYEAAYNTLAAAEQDLCLCAPRNYCIDTPHGVRVVQVTVGHVYVIECERLIRPPAVVDPSPHPVATLPTGPIAVAPPAAAKKYTKDDVRTLARKAGDVLKDMDCVKAIVGAPLDKLEPEKYGAVIEALNAAIVNANAA